MTTTPVTSNPNVLPTIGTSGGTSNGTANSSALNFTSNFNTFLTLLTTQLQNQDPLSPMDTNAFTQQLVSFSEVEQQINTNSNLQQLIQLQTAGETIAATPLVGQNIEYSGSTAPLTNGQASFVYSLPSAAANTSLVVTDANGNIVYSTTGDTTAGSHSFVWNGTTNSGQHMPSGAYSLSVIASDSTSNPITASIDSIGTVSSVGVSNGQATFSVGGIAVPMSELVAVNPSNSTTTAN
ncbi:MAG TPA: flagellar hook capping FlgD N-terminal domain-containing protein [Stellaceae bacterium]|nr:flagellar hook capping FlgD N-terminal domain-containing protein [Stellaceae bacterium]